jgi:hypothetical protein
MKINLNKQDFKKLINLLQVRENNINVSDMYLYYLLNESNSINEKMIRKYNKNNNLKNAFYHSFLEVMEVESDDELKYIESINHIDDMEVLDVKKYLSNPYYKKIKTPELKLKNLEFKYDTFKPYEGFMYKDISFDNNNYAEITHFGFFKEEFKYLTISQNNEIWMSITPHEIETMDESISKANGIVAVFGLGLGYYPYMISLKEDVKKIYIIEKDKNVISLFKEHILPQFEYKDKIEIINDDAFNFMKKMKSYSINYAFIDLWHNVDDGISLYIHSLHEELDNITYSYWIEPSFIAYIRRNLLTLIDEQADNADSSNYINEENYDDHIINELYKVTKNLNISSYEELHDLLKESSIRKLLKQIKY